MKRGADLKSTLTSDVEMQFGVCPDGFWSYLILYFSIKFWHGNVYPVIFEVCDLHFDFDFIGDCS